MTPEMEFFLRSILLPFIVSFTIVFLVIRYGQRKPKPRAQWGREPTATVLVKDTDEGKLFAQIAQGRCPDCAKATTFRMGPEGGMSVNIVCAEGHWFNVNAFSTNDGIAERIRR